MDSELLFERMQSLGGARSKVEAEAVLRASLGALGAYLPAADRAALARVLPLPLLAALDRVPVPGEASVSALGAALARECNFGLGQGLERLEIACGVVAECLNHEQREGIRRHLPDAIASLLTLPSAEHSPPRPEHTRNAPPATARTLATAREGSGHPLSEARPDRAQSGSVARWDDSNAGHTLGGYQGDERMQHGETLATGKPGSKHGLSDG